MSLLTLEHSKIAYRLDLAVFGATSVGLGTLLFLGARLAPAAQALARPASRPALRAGGAARLLRRHELLLGLRFPNRPWPFSRCTIDPMLAGARIGSLPKTRVLPARMLQR
jgi:hypothetical protein